MTVAAIAPALDITTAPHARERQLTTPLLLVSALVLLAIVGPWIAPYPPNAQLDLAGLKSQAPSMQHPFGTDGLSRDVLSRVLAGARVSLSFAAGAVLLSLSIGTLYGTLAAFLGGTAERVLMRTLDIAMALPRLLLLMTISALWHPSLFSLVLIIGASGWFDVARIVRGEMTLLLRRDFVLAARSMGVRPWRLLTHHALPHLLPTLVVTGTLAVAQTIALESALDYLGLGLPVPTASFGTVLSEGYAVMDTQWWLTVFPGLAIVLAVFVCNAFGDALRDSLSSKQVHA